MSTERERGEGEAPQLRAADPVELVLRRHLRALPRASAPSFQRTLAGASARTAPARWTRPPWLISAALIAAALSLLLPHRAPLSERADPIELAELAEGLSFDPFSGPLPSDLFFPEELLDEERSPLQLTDPWFSEPIWSAQRARKEDL